MPHTNRKSRVPPPYKPASFLNIPLTDEDKAAIKATPIHVEGLDTSLESMLRDGYKISLKLDTYNDCYACYVLSPEKPGQDNQILTGRGTTPLKAVRQALYIHRIILAGDWPAVRDIQMPVIDD